MVREHDLSAPDHKTGYWGRPCSNRTMHFWHLNKQCDFFRVTPAAVIYPEEFMQSQCSWAENKTDQQQPKELVTKELQKGLICEDSQKQ